MVILAPGGVLAELYADAAIRMAPVDVATAEAMVAEVKGLAVLRGYRGRPRGDLAALSQLAGQEEILEAAINPLLVKAETRGVVAVDGLIRCGDSVQQKATGA